MSWDFRVDKNGKLEVIVSRWNNSKGERVMRMWAEGFEPNEPVQVEIVGAEEIDAIKQEAKS